MNILEQARERASRELAELPARKRARVYVGGAQACDLWIETRVSQILAESFPPGTFIGTDAQGIALRHAVRILGEMTKNAPDYSVTVQPFAEAHQQACVVLATLQGMGFEEAN